MDVKTLEAIVDLADLVERLARSSMHAAARSDDIPRYESVKQIHANADALELRLRRDLALERLG